MKSALEGTAPGKRILIRKSRKVIEEEEVFYQEFESGPLAKVESSWIAKLLRKVAPIAIIKTIASLLGFS